MVDTASRYLLWAHVGERAGNSSALGDATFGSPSGETKVHDPNSDPGAILTYHHDVLRFYVSVSYAARMAVFECFGNLDSNVDNFAQRKRAFALEPAQVRSLDNGHDKEERSFVLAKIEDWHD